MSDGYASPPPCANRPAGYGLGVGHPATGAGVGAGGGIAGVSGEDVIGELECPCDAMSATTGNSSNSGQARK